MKHLFLIAALVLLSTSITTASNLYGRTDTRISSQLDTLNRTYNINTDIHVLNNSDTCSNRTDFSACVRNTTDDSVDLIFVINPVLRKMETSVRDSTLSAIPKADTLDREQSAVTSMQDNDITSAINAYIASIQSYMDDRCLKFNASQCTLESLTTAIILDKEQAKEDRARTQLMYMKRILGLIIASIGAIGANSRRNKRQRNRRNKELLHQLVEHTKFLALTISHDSNIAQKNKKELLAKVMDFDTQLESLLSSSSDRIAMKIRNEAYPAQLESLSDEYTEILQLIQDKDNISDAVEEVKKIDL